jgi:hypothetical protein
VFPLFQTALQNGVKESVVKEAVQQHFEMSKKAIPDVDTLMKMVSAISKRWWVSSGLFFILKIIFFVVFTWSLIFPLFLISRGECEFEDSFVKVSPTPETNLCAVCMENKVSILILPCAHLSVCPECAGSLVECPICRKPFKGYVRAFLTS